jgi:hypothetical protein
MVTRIDRLARSIGDRQDIVRAVGARGASLKATEQPIDTSAARPDDTRFAAHEKTPVACEKSSPQGQNGPDSRAPAQNDSECSTTVQGGGKRQGVSAVAIGVCYLDEGARAGSRSGLPIPNDP